MRFKVILNRDSIQGFKPLQIAIRVEVMFLRRSRTCLSHAHFNCQRPDLYDTFSIDQSDMVS